MVLKASQECGLGVNTPRNDIGRLNHYIHLWWSWSCSWTKFSMLSWALTHQCL